MKNFFFRVFVIFEKSNETTLPVYEIFSGVDVEPRRKKNSEMMSEAASARVSCFRREVQGNETK